MGGGTMARTFAAAAGRAGLTDGLAVGAALTAGRWVVLILALLLATGLVGAGLCTGLAVFAGCADLPTRPVAFPAAPGRFAAECRAIDFPAVTFLPDAPPRVAAGFFAAAGFRAGAAFFAATGFFVAGCFFFAGVGFFAGAGFLAGATFFADGRDFATVRALAAGLLLLAAVPVLVGLDRAAGFFISSASPTCPWMRATRRMPRRLLLLRRRDH